MGIQLFSHLPTSVQCLSQNIKEMKPEFQEYVLSQLLVLH